MSQIKSPVAKIPTSESENEKLKNALRVVFERQKKSSADNEQLKIENEKLVQTVRKQATSIPELQIQNRVLKQQIKNLINDMHIVEKAKEDFLEKFNQIKKKLTLTRRNLWLTRILTLFLFASSTAMIYISYRESAIHKNTLVELRKITNENESLVLQNKNYFNERDAFQNTIQNKYKDQVETLNQKIAVANREKSEYYQKLNQAIENFKRQKIDLENEHNVFLNLTKNEYENKIQALNIEKKLLNDQLIENQVKNRDLSLKDINVTSTEDKTKYQQFMKQVNNPKDANNPETIKSTPATQNVDPSLPPDSSFAIEPFEISPIKNRKSSF